MSRYEFHLPDLGEGVTESEIATWRVAIGDVIREDQPLVDMLTQKAAVEIPSPVGGRVLELCGKVGDVLAVGRVLAVIETDTALQAAPIPGNCAPQEHVAFAPAQGAEADRPMASPSVRKKARELAIDLATVRGTGRSGRITHEDLDRRARVSDDVARGDGASEYESLQIVGLRRKIAEAMERSNRIPHFSYVEEIDVTELEELRSHLNSTRTAGPKLTLIPFLMRALINVLPRFPSINANFDDGAGVLHRYRPVHVGIATQTKNGLVVPVVRNAQALDLWGAASEVGRLANAARDGKATLTELTGSTITITSLGKLGGIATTPVINGLETAIIGVNRIIERPAFQRGTVVPRLFMNLSSSFDHRVVDGWDAASFIQGIRLQLEHPATLFMGHIP